MLWTRARLGAAALVVTVVWAPTGCGAPVASAGPVDGSPPRGLRFGEPVIYPSPGSAPTDLITPDLNADGAADIVAVLVDSSGVAVAVSDGSGRYGAASKHRTGTEPRSVAAGDLDADGDLDLVAGHFSDRVAVLLGNGRGGFGPAADLSTIRRRNLASDPQWLALVDVDRDDRLDIVGVSVENEFLVLRNLGQGRFARPDRVELPGRRYDNVATGDLDGDRSPDVVIADGHDGVLVLRNDGSGAFADPERVSTDAVAPPPQPPMTCSGDVCTGFAGPESRATIAIADVDADGRADLVVGHTLTPGITLLPGSGRGRFGEPQRVASELGPTTAVAIADLDGDGTSDLAAVVNGTRRVAVILGVRGGGFGVATEHKVAPRGAYGVAVADLNGDGAPDIAVTDVLSNDLAVLLATDVSGADPRAGRRAGPSNAGPSA